MLDATVAGSVQRLMELRSDFQLREVVYTPALPWSPSPLAGVERRMLDCVGQEVARATSMVRYAHSGDHIFLKSDKNNFGFGAACLNQTVSLSHVFSADRFEHFAHSRSDSTSIDFACHIGQQLVLLNHIGGLVHRSREHELPVQAGGFRFHAAHGHREIGVVVRRSG